MFEMLKLCDYEKKKIARILTVFAGMIMCVTFFAMCSSCSFALQLNILDIRMPSVVGTGTYTYVDVVIKNEGDNKLSNLTVEARFGSKEGISSLKEVLPGEIAQIRVVLETPEKEGVYPLTISVKKRDENFVSKVVYVSVSPVVIKYDLPPQVSAGVPFKVEGYVFVGDSPAEGYVTVYVDGSYACSSELEKDGKFECVVRADTPGLHTMKISYERNHVTTELYVVEWKNGREKGRSPESKKENIKMPFYALLSSKEADVVAGNGNIVRLFVWSGERSGAFKVVVENQKSCANISEIIVPAPVIMGVGEERTMSIFVKGITPGECAVRLAIEGNDEKLWEGDLKIRVMSLSGQFKGEGAIAPFQPGVMGIVLLFSVSVAVILVFVISGKKIKRDRKKITESVAGIIGTLRGERLKPIKLDAAVKKKVKDTQIYVAKPEQVIY